MAAQDLTVAFQRTDAVVDATVMKVELFEWSFPPLHEICGHKVKLRINKAYSGSYEGEINVGTAGALVTGQRYLLFLDERVNGFMPSDVIHEYPEEVEKLKEACLANIPLVKDNWRYSSIIGGRGQKYVLMSRGLRIPLELQEFRDTVHSNWFINGIPLGFEKSKLTKEEEDRMMENIPKMDSICRQVDYPCLNITLLPLKQLDEWLDGQLDLKANE